MKHIYLKWVKLLISIKILALDKSVLTISEIRDDIDGAIRFFFNQDEADIEYYYYKNIIINKDPIRNQVDVREILNMIDNIDEAAQGDKDIIIVLTENDIYIPPMNFIFGIADTRRRRIVLSLYRLKRNLYLTSAAEHGRFKERVFKEIMHELGHILGLGHCNDKRCVMSFSNTILEVDNKLPMFCSGCISKLKSIMNKY